MRTTPILVILAFLFIGLRTSSAEESASSLATKLEAQILSSPEVMMSFTSPSQGKITVKADLKGKRVRLETPTMLLISDGKTIWNINKKTDRVTIDAVSEHSAFRDPTSLFRFSNNYLAQLASHNGATYTIDLIPGKDIAALFAQAGSDQRLRVSLKPVGKTVKIVSAKAISSTGQSSTGPVTLTQIKRTKASDFEFQRTAAMKIIDLRE
jgi:outer membrane lipoprotein-sorting protein